MDRIAHLSCFVPAFNEAENIAAVIEEALEVLPKLAESFEFIVVDDGSSDGTAAIVRSFAERLPEVKLAVHETNLGYGHALRTGLREATGDVVCFTDADRQFRFEDLSRLLPLLGTSDAAVGFRIKRNDPWHRLVVAFVYHHVLAALFKVGVRDVDCAMKAFSRRFIDTVVPELESRSAFISPELLIRARRHGLRVTEIGVPHYPRAAGRPKGAPPKVIWRTIREIAAMRRRLGRP